VDEGRALCGDERWLGNRDMRLALSYDDPVVALYVGGRSLDR
jgi:hypothetical protein